MKNKDIYSLKQAILAVKNKGSNKFKLAIIRNETKVDEYIKALEELRKPSTAMEEYKKKRNEILLQHAELENGGLVVYTHPKGQGQKADYGFPNIIHDLPGYEIKMNSLNNEYEVALTEDDEKQKAFEVTLSEESSCVDFVRIPFADVPEVGYEELKVMMPLIDV